MSQFYDAALAPVGIKSTQYSILNEVDRGGLKGQLTMCELATAMVMDRSTLGHNLRPLERDKLLVLRLAMSDRRKRHVELTKKGPIDAAACAPPVENGGRPIRRYLRAPACRKAAGDAVEYRR